MVCARKRSLLIAFATALAVVLATACTGGTQNSEDTATPSPQGTTRSGTPAPLTSAERAAIQANIGSAADASVIDSLDIDVEPDGTGLPQGHGTVQEGEQLYAAQCLACHGPQGKGATGLPGPALVSGPGPWKPGMPKTIGTYWPYSTTVYDYIRRAMPFTTPGSLTDDQVYAVVAYLLNQNQLIPADQEMNQDTLPKVQMPNRDNFIQCWPDACRPDVKR